MVDSQVTMSSEDTTEWEDEKEQEEIDFVTLGMFIIGEFDPPTKCLV